jgi:hypothetical protein
VCLWHRRPRCGPASYPVPAPGTVKATAMFFAHHFLRYPSLPTTVSGSFLSFLDPFGRMAAVALPTTPWGETAPLCLHRQRRRVQGRLRSDPAATGPDPLLDLPPKPQEERLRRTPPSRPSGILRRLPRRVALHRLRTLQPETRRLARLLQRPAPTPHPRPALSLTLPPPTPTRAPKVVDSCSRLPADAFGVKKASPPFLNFR